MSKDDGISVHVTGSDYQYDGWLASVFTKRSGTVRYVVEDANGRLFIHNAKQLGVAEGWMSEVLPDAAPAKKGSKP
jgi:hypothetical protein